MHHSQRSRLAVGWQCHVKGQGPSVLSCVCVKAKATAHIRSPRFCLLQIQQASVTIINLSIEYQLAANNSSK
jgi:hypothetical protein